MSMVQVAVAGFLITVFVVLVALWCFPGLLGAAKPPKWRGWWWGGE